MENKKEKKFVCDDRPVEVSEKIKKMSEDEIEEEFKERFEDYLKN